MKVIALISLIVANSFTAAFAQLEVGKPAPDFTLKDTAGKEVKLSDYKGKFVVLEWVNYGCPFVKKHYGVKNMQKLQKEFTDKGAVWLSICSSAPGKQGNMPPAEAAAETKALGAASTAYLIDEDGKVGNLYGARTTPEMYIVDPTGKLVYQGAIDDRSSPDPATLEGATNYVKVALTEAMAGKPVTTPVTKSYGCSVKY